MISQDFCIISLSLLETSTELWQQAIAREQVRNWKLQGKMGMWHGAIQLFMSIYMDMMYIYIFIYLFIHLFIHSFIYLYQIIIHILLYV